MDFTALIVHPVKTTAHGRICAGHVIAIVGELLARLNSRGLANNFVALNHEVAAVWVGEDPFATEEGDRAVGPVVDGDEVDESVRLVRRQAAATVVVA